MRRLRATQPRSRLLGKEPVLVISHHAGDEGCGYLEQLRAQAARAGVPMIYAAQHFSPQAEASAGR